MTLTVGREGAASVWTVDLDEPGDLQPIDQVTVFSVNHTTLYFQRGRQFAAREREFIFQQSNSLDFLKLRQVLCARRDLSLQQVDEPSAGVELPAGESVVRRGRKSMMVVMPRLAERREREPCEVARLIPRAEATAAEEVAQRIDGKRGVVQEEDANRPSPQQSR